MSTDYPLMVPGATTDGGEHEVSAPFDGSPIATVTAGDAGTVDHALETAYALYRNRDGWLRPAERIEILQRAAAIMEGRKEELAIEAAREGGKPLIDSRVEASRAIDGVNGCIDELRTAAGTEIPMNITGSSLNRLAVTSHEPIGVVVAVSAFNHPLNLIVHQVTPAVATGCPVIVKPAGHTPLSCFRFVDILHQAGLPPEWCQAMVIKDREASTQLVTDPRVAFFSFIGSPGVGWKLRSQLAPGTRCALEHGGAAPVIVAEDADLDAAVPLLTKGGFYHAGQVCVSVQRVFAHESIAEELVRRLGESASRLTVGDPTSPETEVGPLIQPREVERVGEWVQEAIDGGAECVAGGKKISESCYECTVLYNPPDDVRVSQLEIFGPAVSVYSYSDLDEALARANSLPFAFHSAVFTRSIDTALRCYRRLDASAVMVNDHSAFRVDWMPFAGLKQSGHGVGGIPHTMEEMQIEKLMVFHSKEL